MLSSEKTSGRKVIADAIILGLLRSRTYCKASCICPGAYTKFIELFGSIIFDRAYIQSNLDKWDLARDTSISGTLFPEPSYLLEPR